MASSRKVPKKERTHPKPDRPPRQAALSEKASLTRDLLWVGLAALLLRLGHLISLPSSPVFRQPIMDAFWHHEWAGQIAAGNWEYKEVFFRAPGYPYFLGLLYSLFGASPIAGVLAQQFLGIGTCLLVYLLAWKFIGSRRTALLAGLGAAAYGPFLSCEGQLLFEPLAVPLSLGTVVWLAALGPRRRWITYLLPGLFWGLSAVVRPNFLVFGAAFLWWFWKTREDTKGTGKILGRVGALAAAALLPILPITLHNYQVDGSLVLIGSQGGVNFFIGNNAFSDGKTAMAPGTEREVVAFKDNVWVSSVMQAEKDLGRKLTAGEVSGYWSRRALEFIGGHPLQWLLLEAKKLYFFLHGFEIPNNVDSYLTRRWSPVLTVLLWRFGLFFPFGLIGPLALLGLVLWWRKEKSREDSERGWLVLGCWALYCATILLFFVNDRYRLPAVPVFLLLAAFAVDEGLEGRWGLGSQKFSWLSAGLGLLLLLNLPLWGVTKPIDPTWDLLNVADAYVRDGRESEALEWYQRAYQAWPGSPYVATRMGMALAKMGRLKEAEGWYLKAVEKDPTQVEALINLSSQASKEGNYEQALALSERILAVQPRQTGALYNAANAAFNLNRFDMAEQYYRKALAEKPDYVESWNNLGVLYLETGKFAEAKDAFKSTLALDANRPLVWFDLGIAEQRLGASQDARAHFEEALKRDPKLFEAAFNLAILDEKEERWDEAIVRYRQTLAINPGYIDATLNLGQLFGRVKQDYSSAIQVLEEGRRVSPKNAALAFNLGMAYRLAGRQEEAARNFSAAAALEPGLKEAIEKVYGASPENPQ